MHNCSTVVQTASDLFELEIWPNIPKEINFSALYQTKIAPKILKHCSVNCEQLLQFETINPADC